MSLIDTINDLIPSKEVDVYGESICIRPLTLEKIGLLIPKIQGHWDALQGLGITLEALTSEDNKPTILRLVSYFVSNGIDVLEDVSGVEAGVFKILPIDQSISIVTAVIEINAKSGENLLKNWTSLTNTLNEHLPKDLIKSSQTEK